MPVTGPPHVPVSRQSDFVTGDCTFEIGGRNKGKHRIEKLDNAYVVKDDIEFAQGSIIPFWAFELKY